MTTKTRIVQQRGEEAVLLPELIAAGVAANERAKLRMTLVQEAIAHAQHPGHPPRGFEAELSAAGLPASALDIIIGARKLGADRFALPGLGKLWRELHGDIDDMLRPVSVADRTAADASAVRLAALKRAIPALRDDVVAAREIASLTSVHRERSDSEHLLVMDLHQEINRLAAEAATRDWAPRRHWQASGW